MRSYNVVLSIALGVLVTIGLVIVLDSGAAPVEAQSLLTMTAPAIDHSDAVGDAISAALAYLHTQQQPDGGIDAFGMGASNEGGTILSVLSLAASGRPANSMAYSGTGKTMVDYLTEHAISYTHQTTYTTSDYLFPQQAGYLLMAVTAADQAPTGFGGMDLVAQLEDTYQPATGAYSTTAHEGFYTGAAEDDNQATVILGLVAAGRSVPVTATNYLLNSQAASGSWGTDDDPDTAAMVVLALVASGHVRPTDAAIQKALDYLRNAQLLNGGWRPFWDIDPANANSTGWVIQALVAVGYTPATESWAASPNPHEALLALQKPNGCIGGTYANAFSTAGALLGLTERPVFALGQTLRALRALTWINELQAADGSWPSAFGHPAGPACDAVLAYAAAGFDPDTVKAPGSVTSAMDYLVVVASSFGDESAAAAGKLALAIEAAGKDAHNFGGMNSVDVVHVLTSTWYSPTTGAFGDANNSWDQTFAILGLAAAGESIPVSATQTLLGLQNPDGSWVDAWGFDKPGSTGLALQALIAAGVPVGDTSIVGGVSALLNEQNDQGSWNAFGSPSVNSTAYAMQGLLAAGEDLTAAKWLKNGHSPYNALADLQRIDGPFTLWSADDFFSTRQAVPAQLGVYYPFSCVLMPFVGVDRGPDPDRMVAASPRATWGDSVDVIIPFGSDLDGDGTVTLDWRVSGATSWVTSAAVYRADGYYTATLAVTRPVVYEFQTTFADPDGVQYANGVTDTVVLAVTLEPYRVHLPLVLKQ